MNTHTLIFKVMSVKFREHECLFLNSKQFLFLFSPLVYFKLFVFGCGKWVFAAVGRSSLLAASGGCSLVAVHGLLTAVAAPVVERGPSCPAACGIFPDQGLKPWPLPWQVCRHQTTREARA